MRQLFATCARFVRQDEGMETVEWAIMAALIVGATATAIATLGTHVLAKFTALVSATQ